MRSADQACCWQHPEIAPIETVGGRIEEEDFTGTDPMAAAPDRQCAARAVLQFGHGRWPSINHDDCTDAADLLTRQSRDMLHERHAGRQIAAVVEEPGDLGARLDGNELAEGHRRIAIDPVETDGRAGARVPHQLRSR